MKRHIKTNDRFLRIIVFFICSLLNLSYAQGAFMLSHINTNQGLSSARVYSIVQAEDGAMWISTKRGVDRYNGLVVKNYELATDNQFSDACGGRNIKLSEDTHHHIFAYDNKGKVYIYNKVQDAFVLQIDLLKMLGGSLVVNEMVVDQHGNFWFAMDKGVFLFPAKDVDGENTTKKGCYILRNTYVNHLVFMGRELLVGFPGGVYVYSPDSRQLRQTVKGVSVLSSYHDAKSHQLWLGTFHSGVKVLDDRSWQPIPSMSSLQEIPLIPVRSIISFDAHTILMGVDGAGVYAYDRKKRQVQLLLNTDGRPDNSLQGNGVYTLCRDRLGDLWVGTYSGGVDLAIPMEHSLELIRHEYLNPQSLVSNSVNDILQGRDGKIWYATDNGVSVYDEKTHLWHHGLKDKVALTLCQTKEGKILVGTYGNGVFEMRDNGYVSQAYSLSNGKLKTDYVYSLFCDSSGDLWIGCLDGDLVHVGANSQGKRGCQEYLPVKEVQCIEESPDKKYIDIGTSHGCYRVDRTSRRIARFYYPEKFPHSDRNFYVNSIAYQDSRHIWIATDGGGLCLFDFKTGKVKTYTTQQSLPSNNVYALLKTPSGRLWMSTDKGLAFMMNGKVVNLNFFKGLECEYKRMSVATTRDGRIFFGSSNGAVALAPQFANGLHYLAPLHIRGIEVEGVPPSEMWNQRIYDMLQEGRLSFSHAENTLVISIESINYQYQHDILYQYYLEGYDRQWSERSAAQEARFANLPPGSYVFHVKAIGRSNGRVLGEVSLQISIAQPWWNSWWAWLVYLCLSGAIVYFGWDYYRERLQRRYYDEKINFFVNTAHNIRTPLSLVLAPLADLAKEDNLGEKSRHFLELAQRNGEKLLRMVTELLDFQKIEKASDNVVLQDMALNVFLRQQVDKFAPMASEKHIGLTLGECSPLMVRADLKMMDLIFENLLSNAIKYTPDDGQVTLALSSTDNKQAKICVTDTGIGIPKAESKHIFQSFYRASNAVKSKEMGSGLGLMLTRHLVQKLGGTLSFVSEEGKGTTFVLTLDLSVSAASYEESDEKQRDTILFVDDNADLRQYIRMAFGDTYHIVDVESGEAALQYLSENGVCDLVVSDVMMPGIQGDELCRRIKENKETSWLPVILLTAKAGRNFMLEGLGLGADDYVAKPFDSAILAGKIDSMLKNRRRLSLYYMERSLAMARGESQPVDEPSESLASDSPGETSPIPEGEEKAGEPELNPANQEFVDKATRLVMSHLSDTDFSIDSLCREMAMSRTLFYGKLKTLTGEAPQDFIRLIRLEQAAMYLRQGNSVLDVSVKTGFVNVKYFSTVFKKHFGVPPSKF